MPRKPKTWGGARVGAGRPPRGPRSSEPHKQRPVLLPGHRVHVTVEVVREVGSLRSPLARGAIDRAVATSRLRDDFSILHLAAVARRLELIVEASDRTALARGMQGFQIAAARYLNASVGRSGTVFPDRYRARYLRSPASVRAAIAALP